MGKVYKTGFLIILFLMLAILGAYICSHFLIKPTKKEGFSVVINKISKYGYTLDERDSKLMKEKFEELKETLSKDSVDMKEYASLLSQMYILDLYNINDKVNKYDVPCLEYILPAEKDKFKLMIKEEFYSKLIDNADGDRKQELPIVKTINVTSNEETKFQIHDKEFEGYKVVVEWDYEKDLGYDKKSEINLIIDDNKLYVVKHSPIID